MNEIESSQANQFFDSFTTQVLPNIIVAVIIVVATACVAHLATRVLRKILHADKTLPTMTIFINIMRIAIWAIGISLVCSHCLGINVSAVVTALGVGGIAISLGFQDTLANLIGGLQVSVMRIVEPGDYIQVGSDIGVVQDTTWRHTTIVGEGGEQRIIPNKAMNSSTITKLPPIRKVKVPISVGPYYTDLDAVAESMCAEVKAAVQEKYPVEGDPSVVFTGNTEFSYAGVLTLWVEEGHDLSVTDILFIRDLVLRTTAPYAKFE